ncbi:MAG: alpha/beta family hydrolase [Candidatus Acidiferrales bacterium]|jgi:predicted alpha/beta-hydrolase family hydrolase
MASNERFEDAPSDGPRVRGYLHVPENSPSDALVLTHGAGANCNSPLLVALATAFCESGLTVLRCDLLFRQLRPHGPPPRGSAERDQQGLRRAVEAIRRQVPGRVFLGGHSYGGRQGSMLAASEPGLADALLLLSYPLHPPKDPANVRTAHFSAIRTPALFVHGTRDAFGTIDEMTAALKLIPARTLLVPVEGAGHELISARAPLPQTIVESFASFLSAPSS